MMQAFLDDLTGPDKWLRAAALKLIGVRGWVHLLPQLTAALADPEPLVRVTALYALAQMGAVAALPAVRGLLADEAVSWLTYGERVCDAAQQVAAQLAALAAAAPAEPPHTLPDVLLEPSPDAPALPVAAPQSPAPADSIDDFGSPDDAALDPEPTPPDAESVPAVVPAWLREAGVEAREDIPDWLMDTITLAQKPGTPIPPPITLTPAPPVEPLLPTEETTRFSRFAAPPPAAADVSEAQFTAFYPHVIATRQRYSLIVYAHTAGALAAVERDAERYRDELGSGVPVPSTARQSAALSADTPLTVVPECDELLFDPPQWTRRWSGDWTRFPFDCWAVGSVPAEGVTVRVSIQVRGVELAHIVCILRRDPTRATATDTEGLRFPVAGSASAADAAAPLAAARFTSQTVQRYRRIFVSYAREDREVAEAYRFAQLAAGHDVFTDTYSVRSGDHWRAALARAIDQADIFQLFWSPHAAESPHVRDEWRYALQFRCPETLCEGFIRPVFWREPLVEPPRDLRHLNFRPVRFVVDPPD